MAVTMRSGDFPSSRLTVLPELGIVVIGRNEGQRLARCLDALKSSAATLVYVDSGSTDGSIDLACSKGVDTVRLDESLPFTAARSRNAGFDHILEMNPRMQFVQFLDGDCQIIDGWLQRGLDELQANPAWAIAAGRVLEECPEVSVYNRLCDIEWDTPVGEARFCGGNALVRVAAFRQAGGFNPAVIAGEEPELCVRMRHNGWKIMRVDADMNWHDAGILHFWQWWRRRVRSGHAYAEGYAMHGQPPERHFAREVFSNWAWGAAIPVLALALARPTHGLSILLLLAYPLLAARMFVRLRRQGVSRPDAGSGALFMMLGKFPEALGQARFLALRQFGFRSRCIEYKAPQNVSSKGTIPHTSR